MSSFNVRVIPGPAGNQSPGTCGQELTINHGRKEPYQLGAGYEHIAFAVDDLDLEHARMTAAGLDIKPIKEFHREGALMARFFFVEDPDGYRIEVLQRHGRYR